jgi:hypothetical protein
MKSKILGLIAAGLLACSTTANALIIEINGQGSANGQWDVTTLTGEFYDLLPILDDQVWWGSEILAEAFALEVLEDLGLPNFGSSGPLFAYGDSGGVNTVFDACLDSPFDNPIACGTTSDDETWTFAVASRVEEAVPVPGTIALLGFGLVGLVLSLRRKSVCS